MTQESCIIMELPYYYLLFTFLFLFKLIISYGFISRPQNPEPKLPPGPWKLPIVGSIHHLFGALPHHALRDLAKIYGPLMHLKLGEVSTLIISSAEAAKEIMKTHDINFATRPEILTVKIMTYGGRDVAFAPYGDYWRQLRKMCVLELLSAKRVQSFRSIREEEVSDLNRYISSANNTSPINISKRLTSLTNDIISRAVFGSKCKDQRTLLSAMSETTEVAGGFNLADLFPSSKLVCLLSSIKYKSERCHRKVDRILNEIVLDHKERKRDQMRTSGPRPFEEGLLDALLRLQEQDGHEFEFTMDSIKAVIYEIFAAGSETSSTTLEWVMSELMRNPREMEKVQSELREFFRGKEKVTEADLHELNYFKLVIKETLRLHTPVPLLLPRECRKTCEIFGYEIPVKTRVVVNAWAVGRDRQYWDDPESFEPERFDDNPIEFMGANYEFIPFGAGRRMCPGILFGLANVELPLAQLLYYFDWQLPHGAEPKDLDMTESFGATSPRRSALYLCAIPHFPCP